MPFSIRVQHQTRPRTTNRTEHSQDGGGAGFPKLVQKKMSINYFWTPALRKDHYYKRTGKENWRFSCTEKNIHGLSNSWDTHCGIHRFGQRKSAFHWEAIDPIVILSSTVQFGNSNNLICVTMATAM